MQMVVIRNQDEVLVYTGGTYEELLEEVEHLSDVHGILSGFDEADGIDAYDEVDGYIITGFDLTQEVLAAGYVKGNENEPTV